MIDKLLHSEKENVHFDQHLAPCCIKEAATVLAIAIGGQSIQALW